MLAEWSAECASDAPVLVLPWTSDATDPDAPHFIDLRENPYDVDYISEAVQYPPLLHALRALNGSRSPVFTAKCDAWAINCQELDQLRITLDLDLTQENLPAGFASYIDILFRDRPRFTSIHYHQQILDRIARRAVPLDHPYATLECVVRPALIDLTIPQEGFAITLYIRALGPDTFAASQNWSLALESIVALLRSKDFA